MFAHAIAVLERFSSRPTRRNRNHRHSAHRGRSLRCEPLEARQLLAITNPLAELGPAPLENPAAVSEAMAIADEQPGVAEGYTLLAPMRSQDTLLIDNEGSVVHSWTSNYSPGLSAYLLEDGTLMRTASPTGPSQSFDVGGAGGRVEQWSWDGNLLWEFVYASDDYRLHHDIEVLPNGNVLMIAWQRLDQAEAVAAGRDPSLLSEGELWPDHIIEVQPTGSSGGEIVWEWHAVDHLVQDHDPQQANYGNVAEHPELIDVNFVSGRAGADWTHINSIDYNAELDQILLSVRGFNEIWVIDHSTTTEEAAGHTGGRSGRGGDLLYRWGNPQTYDAGTAGDQALYGQHDAEWIADNLPGEDNILVFNNGNGRDYSSVDEIAPPVQPDGCYGIEPGSAYAPDGLVWTYTADPAGEFYADHISGSQRLANGNTLITDGTGGALFEVTREGEVVWEHEVGGEIFRADRYAPEYPGFDGTPLDDEQDTARSYAVVDTGQSAFYDNSVEIAAPDVSEAFYGQDARYAGNQPSYTISPDGLTVYDNVTGLTWTRSPDLDGDGDIDVDDKLSFAEAEVYADATLNAQDFAGYDDWRLPSMKELYSLMDFRGTDPPPQGTDTSGLSPFIDTDYFEFGYGDTAADERIIDAQFWSSNEYVGAVFGNQQAAFGLNLADGRIKGYPSGDGPVTKLNYVYFVRGNDDYGVNAFQDNGDGTVTDNATGLMWSQDDSAQGMDWESALAWVQQKNADNYLGHNDWRLPNAKELQSIVDYGRSPDTTGSPAIDPVFNTTEITNEAGQTDYGFYWTGTTHVRADGNAGAAVYLAFGRGLGSMDGTNVIDVHGAGCQRSDPKAGDPSDYPTWGHGPQGDVQRVFNFVRLVRDTSASPNAAPQISGTTHAPEVPGEGEPVWVTSTITDDGGVASATLTYDTGNGPVDVAMFDDGQHGDGDPGDGVFGAQIAGVAAGTTVQYFVSATDDSGAMTRDPVGAPGDAYRYTIGSLRAEVVDRHIFYNNSFFDGNGPSVNVDDLAAMAPHTSTTGGHGPHPHQFDEVDKELGKDALLPGQTATFANYTSYVKGINGIMVDVAGLADAEQLDPSVDFTFRVGNTDEPGQWRQLTGAELPTLTVMPAEGTPDANGNPSDRIVLTWPDHAIEKQWLQVTVRATTQTGLAEADVHYWGNAVGESGQHNTARHALVTTADYLGGRHFRHDSQNRAAISDPYDYNKDGTVNRHDSMIARTNRTHFFNALKMITVPGGDTEPSPPPRTVDPMGVQKPGAEQASERAPDEGRRETSRPQVPNEQPVETPVQRPADEPAQRPVEHPAPTTAERLAADDALEAIARSRLRSGAEPTAFERPEVSDARFVDRADDLPESGPREAQRSDLANPFHDSTRGVLNHLPEQSNPRHAERPNSATRNADLPLQLNRPGAGQNETVRRRLTQRAVDAFFAEL